MFAFQTLGVMADAAEAIATDGDVGIIFIALVTQATSVTCVPACTYSSMRITHTNKHTHTHTHT